MTSRSFGHQDAITGLDSLSRERCVTAGGRDRSVRVWKIAEESQLVFHGHEWVPALLSFLCKFQTMSRVLKKDTAAYWKQIDRTWFSFPSRGSNFFLFGFLFFLFAWHCSFEFLDFMLQLHCSSDFNRNFARSQSIFSQSQKLKLKQKEPTQDFCTQHHYFTLFRTSKYFF